MTKDAAEALVILSTIALYISLCYFIGTYYINSPIAMMDLAKNKTVFTLCASFIPSLASASLSVVWVMIWTLIIDNKFPKENEKEKKDKNTYKFK